jgi:hypothetical protein
MRSLQFSIAALMAVVLIGAIGLAALKNATATWASDLYLATLVAICIALVGAFCRPARARGLARLCGFCMDLHASGV